MNKPIKSIDLRFITIRFVVSSWP